MESPCIDVRCRFSRIIRGKTYVLVGRHHGMYVFPGGRIALGEHWLTTAVRATKENIDVELTTQQFSDWVSITNDVFGPKMHYITIFVTAEFTDTEISSIKNIKPDIYEGWEWIEEVRLCSGKAGTIFLPLQHLYDDKGSASWRSA